MSSALPSDFPDSCTKVKKMLLEIPGLGIQSLREDLFLVTEPESGVEFTVDVEEDTLFLRAEVADFSRQKVESTENLFRFLLEANGEAVHVAFGLEGDQVVIKGDLEIENLDANELEASCKALIWTLYQHSDKLAEWIAV
jgi:hypothetical protein